MYRDKIYIYCSVVKLFQKLFIIFCDKRYVSDILFIKQCLGHIKEICGKPFYPSGRKTLVAVFYRHVVKTARKEELNGHKTCYHACMVLFHKNRISDYI